MILLLTLIADKSFIYIKKEERFTLPAGQYIVHCYGAQGGYGHYFGNKGDRGGYGAHVYGTMTLKGTENVFYAFVGGVGSSSKNGPNEGGYNGGGKSGKSNYGYGSGGGGGATDIRIGDTSINNRIIVAAGGSGGTYNALGADGGDLKGRHKNAAFNLVDSDDTTQSNGDPNGQGGEGDSGSWVSGSGGGGGYRGGKGGKAKTLGLHAPSIGDSGSSYISGHDGCEPHPSIEFFDTKMIVGEENIDNGHVMIQDVYVCSKNCYSCTEDKTCDVCIDNYYLYQNQCYEQCPPKTIPVESIIKICEPCKYPCETCSSSITHCDTCADGFYLYENKCIDECPAGYIPNDGICKQCDENCLSCSETTGNCHSCIKGYSLYNNKCLHECPPKTVSINQVCEVCESPCSSCSIETTHCESCIDDYYLYQNECTKECPVGYISINKVCEQCQSPCSTCSIETTHCESCIDDYYLYQNECIKECPVGYTSINKVCEQCQSPCNSCSETITHCNSCEIGFYLYNNECLSDCSSLNNKGNKDYYGKDDKERQCKKCSVNDCIKCSDDYSICQICSESYHLDEMSNKCIINPTHAFSNSKQFSESHHFSSSKEFTQSSKFMPSFEFTKSKDFTQSQKFTQSSQFTSSLHSNEAPTTVNDQSEPIKIPTQPFESQTMGSVTNQPSQPLESQVFESMINQPSQPLESQVFESIINQPSQQSTAHLANSDSFTPSSVYLKDNGKDKGTEILNVSGKKNFVQSFWWIIIVIAAVIIVTIVIVIVIYKKKNSQKEDSRNEYDMSTNNVTSFNQNTNSEDNAFYVDNPLYNQTKNIIDPFDNDFNEEI